MIDLAPLVNKTVSLKFCGAELSLDLSHALFSSFDIDVGTRLLLKIVGKDKNLEAAEYVLDMGSGVGVIGLAIAASHPHAFVEARDRDLLACAFTERNRARNKIGNFAVLPGLLAEPRAGAPQSAGQDPALLAVHPEKGYDYILSNLPAKAGAPILEAFFKDAAARLSPKGRLAFVIVKPLETAAETWLKAAGFEIADAEHGAGHKAYILTRNAASGEAQTSAASAPADTAPQPGLDLSGLDLKLYVRTHGHFKSNGASYDAYGFWGLKSFDTLSFDDEAAAELAERSLPGCLVRDALIINPGPGHLALWLSRRISPDRISCASRDILSLAAAGANLAAQPGRRPEYRALSPLELNLLPQACFDFIACFPDVVPGYDWIAQTWTDVSHLLKAGGVFIMVAPPTEIMRAEKRKAEGFSLIGEKRRKGSLAAAWRRQ